MRDRLLVLRYPVLLGQYRREPQEVVRDVVRQEVRLLMTTHRLAPVDDATLWRLGDDVLQGYPGLLLAGPPACPDACEHASDQACLRRRIGNRTGTSRCTPSP